ncbi:hypothetical protein PR048_000554 [Dryococelus australis]|uniref:Uncharacterized protein n=1 Tax=Dryococelus australis TaxID=614101 RepID=A0ABQ9IEZ1_9NEOP|nr:hypothetical protein PR048_000554 [Dryococelus australis]
MTTDLGGAPPTADTPALRAIFLKTISLTSEKRIAIQVTSGVISASHRFQLYLSVAVTVQLSCPPYFSFTPTFTNVLNSHWLSLVAWAGELLTCSPPTKVNRAQFPTPSPELSHVGNVPGDTAGRSVFSGRSRFLCLRIPPLFHLQLVPRSSTEMSTLYTLHRSNTGTTPHCLEFCSCENGDVNSVPDIPRTNLDSMAGRTGSTELSLARDYLHVLGIDGESFKRGTVSMPSRSMSSPVPFTTFGVVCTPASRSIVATSSTNSRAAVAQWVENPKMGPQKGVLEFDTSGYSHAILDTVKYQDIEDPTPIVHTDEAEGEAVVLQLQHVEDARRAHSERARTAVRVETQAGSATLRQLGRPALCPLLPTSKNDKSDGSITNTSRQFTYLGFVEVMGCLKCVLVSPLALPCLRAGSKQGGRRAPCLLACIQMLNALWVDTISVGWTTRLPHGGVAPGFSHVRIVPDDAVGQRVSSGISHFPPPFYSGAAPCSPRFIRFGSQDLDRRGRECMRTTRLPTEVSRTKIVCEKRLGGGGGCSSHTAGRSNAEGVGTNNGPRIPTRRAGGRLAGVTQRGDPPSHLHPAARSSCVREGKGPIASLLPPERRPNYLSGYCRYQVCKWETIDFRTYIHKDILSYFGVYYLLPNYFPQILNGIGAEARHFCRERLKCEKNSSVTGYIVVKSRPILA